MGIYAKNDRRVVKTPGPTRLPRPDSIGARNDEERVCRVCFDKLSTNGAGYL